MNLVNDILLTGEIGNKGRRHHHGNGSGKQLQEDIDIIAMETEPCKLQKKMHLNKTGTKFLALFEHLCKKGTDPDLALMIFGNPNLNAEQVNLGVNDHLYATTILKKMQPEEREKLYELAETFIDQGKDFKFDKQHNMFQEMHKQQQNFKDLLSFNFGGMMMQNLTYNLPRLSLGFANNLLVGEHFDNITNIRLQSYRHEVFEQNPNIGFYIYVGENDKNIQTHFFDCEHESGKSFKITKVTNQDGWGPSIFGFGSESIPDKDEHGSYYDGLIKEFAVDGKKIFIDKDPFSDKDGGEKEELKKEEQPRTSKADPETEPVTEPGPVPVPTVTEPEPVKPEPVTESGPGSDPEAVTGSELVTVTESEAQSEPQSAPGSEPVPEPEADPSKGGKRKTKKKKNKTKKRKGKTKKRKTTYKKRKTKKN